MRTALLALALFSLTKAARADPGDAGQVWALPAVEPIPADNASDQGLVLDGWLGGGATRVVKEEGTTGTVGFGITGLYNYRWFELGIGYTLQTAIFTLTSQVPGVLAGVKIDPVPWFRLDLLTESGAYVVSGVGQEFLGPSVVDGGQASRPYLGGRASASFLLGRSRGFLLGWWVNAGDAVGQTTLGTFTVGGGSWSMGLRIGGEIRWR
jgi:hypothetical protein